MLCAEGYYKSCNHSYEEEVVFYMYLRSELILDQRVNRSQMRYCMSQQSAIGGSFGPVGGSISPAQELA